MIYLLSSILSSTLLFLIFRLFGKYKVENAPAIVINYAVAASFGFFIHPVNSVSSTLEKPWLFNAFLIGIMFIIMFNLIALTAQKIGVSVASVANKMSVVVPVIFAVYLYNDTMPFLKVFGIVLALAGVYMATNPKGKVKIEKKYIFLPLILFLGNGFIDTYIKYTEHSYLKGTEVTAFVPILFLFAGVAGLLYAIIRRTVFTYKSLIWGVILGIPNYASIYFLMKTLELENWQSSVVFPVNNMGIVATSAVASFFIFKEHMTGLNWAGILLSVVAILIIVVS